jgi:hypothetical protein
VGDASTKHWRCLFLTYFCHGAWCWGGIDLVFPCSLHFFSCSELIYILPEDQSEDLYSLYILSYYEMSCLIGFLRCFLFYFVGFQPMHAGGLPSHDRDSPPTNMFNSGAPSPPRSSCRCTKYLSRILDLEGCLSLMKHQEKIALDKASKPCSFMK